MPQQTLLQFLPVECQSSAIFSTPNHIFTSLGYRERLGRPFTRLLGGMIDPHDITSPAEPLQFRVLSASSGGDSEFEEFAAMAFKSFEHSPKGRREFRQVSGC